MSVPSLPNHPNLPLEESAAHSAVSVLGLVVGDPPCTIPHVHQPRPCRTDETAPKAISACSPFGLPYSSAPPTTLRPQGLPASTNVPLSSASASDQTQIQAAVHPPSTSMTFHTFDTAHAAPHTPLTTDHSNTVHTCQCVTDGSPCNAEVEGTIRSVRDHLRRVHSFRSAGKDAIKCLWVGCENTLQRESIPRHIISRHLRVKVSCVECGLSLSRRDVRYSHARSCRARRQTASTLGSDVSST